MKKLALAFLMASFYGTLCFGDISSRINMRSVDGSVNTYPYSAKYANGTIIDNGDGTVSIGGATTPVVASSAVFGSATNTSYGNNAWVTVNSSGSSQGLIVNINGNPSGGAQNMLGAITTQALTVGGPPATHIVIVDSTTDAQGGYGLLEIWSNNPLHNDPKLWFHVSGADSSPEIRDDANAPNWEMVNLSTTNSQGLGKWEPAAMSNKGIRLQINSRAYDNSTFENLAFWNPLQAGTANPDGAPGLYLQAQSLTNDGGTLTQADTSIVAFIGTNGSYRGLTGPLAPSPGSLAYALPTSATPVGQVWCGKNSGRGNNFNVRETEFTVSGSSGAFLVSGGNSTGNFPFWTFGLANKTIAQLQALTPTVLGEQYFCSNCANALTCSSTGTANQGQFSSNQATNRTTACN